MNTTTKTQERILGTVHMVNEFTGAERDILVDFTVPADMPWVAGGQGKTPWPSWRPVACPPVTSRR